MNDDDPLDQVGGPTCPADPSQMELADGAAVYWLCPECGLVAVA
jgi:hypothetical protein